LVIVIIALLFELTSETAMLNWTSLRQTAKRSISDEDRADMSTTFCGHEISAARLVPLARAKLVGILRVARAPSRWKRAIVVLRPAHA
jgi:hypothetical protein